MEEKKMEGITLFLNRFPKDAPLLSIIINSITHEEFSYSRSGQIVEFPFCDNKNNRDFWRDNICTYAHLYVYAMLFRWSKETGSEDILKRYDGFVGKFFDRIIIDMSTFLSHRLDNEEETDAIPDTLMNSMEYVVVEFLCKHLFDPELIIAFERNGQLTALLYERYLKMINTDVQTADIEKLSGQLTTILESFKKVGENIKHCRTCIISIIERLCNEDKYSSLKDYSVIFANEEEINRKSIGEIISKIGECERPKERSESISDSSGSSHFGIDYDFPYFATEIYTG